MAKYIALTGALPMEVSGIKCLGDFSRERTGGLEFLKGGIRGKDVALIVSGVGASRAYETARSACASLPLAAYISIGLSASLRPGLAPGDIVVGESTTSLGSPVVGRDTLGAPQGSDARLLRISRETLAGEAGVSFGRLVASERVVVTSLEKKSIAASYGALALDMESASAARAALEAGVPFLVIRAISDGLDENLPVDFNRFTVDGNMDWPRFIRHVLTHPGTIPPLMRLGRNSRLAAKNLATAIEKFVINM